MSRARDIADIGEDVTSLATDAELSSGLASKLPYSYGTATPSTSVDGFLWYDSNSTPPDVKFWDGAAFQALTSGKILQVVRATDTTDRSTTSTSYVDVTGMSVTITPQKSDSALLILSIFNALTLVSANDDARGLYQITDSSNNAISGAEDGIFGLRRYNRTTISAQVRGVQTLVAYSTPATTSAVTYKLRFKSNTSDVTTFVSNSESTGQMYAIEVSA